MVIEELLEGMPAANRQMIELRIEGYEVAEITGKSPAFEAHGRAGPPGLSEPARGPDPRGPPRHDRPPSGQSWSNIDDVVEAYEAARAGGNRGDLAGFLPPPDHPDYLAILCELVRVDLEYSWEDGSPNRLDHYRSRFPELFQDRRWVQEIAFEEFRLRGRPERSFPAGVSPPLRRDTLDWPSSFLDSLDGDFGDRPRPRSLSSRDGDAVAGAVGSAATAYREYREDRDDDPARLRPRSRRGACCRDRPSSSGTSIGRTRTWRSAARP